MKQKKYSNHSSIPLFLEDNTMLLKKYAIGWIIFVFNSHRKIWYAYGRHKNEKHHHRHITTRMMNDDGGTLWLCYVISLISILGLDSIPAIFFTFFYIKCSTVHRKSFHSTLKKKECIKLNGSSHNRLIEQ